MQYRLLDTLGTEDARKCNDLGSNLSLKPEDLAKDSIVDLSSAAVEYLTGKKPAGRGLVGLLEPVAGVHGQAKRADIHGTPEKATEDFKRFKEKGTVKE